MMQVAILPTGTGHEEDTVFLELTRYGLVQFDLGGGHTIRVQPDLDGGVAITASGHRMGRLTIEPRVSNVIHVNVVDLCKGE